jgi:EF-1 guanine nucleotide exchange domain
MDISGLCILSQWLEKSVLISVHVLISVQEAADDDDDDLDLFGDETEEDKKAAAEREAAKASSKKKESKWKFIVVLLKRFMSILTGPKLRLETKLSSILHICSKGLGVCILTNVIEEIRKDLCSIFRFTGTFPFAIHQSQVQYKFVYVEINDEQIWLGGKSSVLMDIKPWDDETDMKKLEEAVRSVEMPGLLWGACNNSYSLNFFFFLGGGDICYESENIIVPSSFAMRVKIS